MTVTDAQTPMNADPLKPTLFDRYHIEIPVTSHQDQLFVCPWIQGYNTAEDVDTVVEAIPEINTSICRRAVKRLQSSCLRRAIRSAKRRGFARVVQRLLIG